MRVFVDTQLWVYAFKKPRRNAFNTLEEYKEALDMHRVSLEFIKNVLMGHIVYMTTHQLAEIYHALAFRGIRMNRDIALEVVEELRKSTKTVIIDVRKKHYREALRLSMESGIHVWDYLCILPLKEYLDIAYTNDKHFLHPALNNLVPRVENPLNKWLTL